MTIARLEAVGFCAHYSPQGDWAFDFAFDLSRKLQLQLNVFHFLDDPYDVLAESKAATADVDPARAVELEKELRFYYEPKLGDFLDVGFRLCEDREWSELHRCLMRREFQVLVLAYPTHGAFFGGRPIEAFAEAFVCPVVLVGPQHRSELRLNPPAAMLAGKLGLSYSEHAERNILAAEPATPLVGATPLR